MVELALADETFSSIPEFETSPLRRFVRVPVAVAVEVEGFAARGRRRGATVIFAIPQPQVTITVAVVETGREPVSAIKPRNYGAAAAVGSAWTEDMVERTLFVKAFASPPEPEAGPLGSLVRVAVISERTTRRRSRSSNRPRTGGVRAGDVIVIAFGERACSALPKLITGATGRNVSIPVSAVVRVDHARSRVLSAGRRHEF